MSGSGGGVVNTLRCVACSYGRTGVAVHCKEAGTTCSPHTLLIATDDVPALLNQV